MQKCKLVIEDQVNCQFVGLDPFIRRKFNDALKFFVPHARHTPAFKLGRWDGKVSFGTASGRTYINMLDRVLPLIMEEYDIEIEDTRPQYTFEFPDVSEDLVSDRLWPEGHVAEGLPIILRDYQVDAIKTYFNNLQSIQSISTGAGKAQPLWSKIKIPNGWVSMKDIQIGDVVSTPDGSSAKVLGIYPQGKKEYYKITFKDGRTAEACGDHLWNVYNVEWKWTGANKNRKAANPWRTLTTREIVSQLKNNKRPIKISLLQNEEKNPANLKIDPYILGCLIGDGSITKHVYFSSNDDHIIDRIRNKLDHRYCIAHVKKYDYIIRRSEDHRMAMLKEKKGNRGKTNLYKDLLSEINIFGKKSDEKFIPKEYIELANLNQKIEIIQGLMDTDGYVGKHGDLSYTTVSHQLALDIVEIVRSIGGLAHITQKIPTYTYKGEKKIGQLAYTVYIRYKNPRDLVSLPRKRNRISEKYQYTDSLKLQITNIELIGETECQCILIDHPDHLYITDNYVVTHNTIVTACLSLCVEKYGRSIIIVPNKSLVEQTEEDYINLGLDVGVFYGDRKEWNKTHTICTWQSLSVFNKNTKRAANKAKKDDEESPVGIDEFLKDVICVIVDEAHTCKGPELLDLLCGPFSNIPIRWGLTGSIPKADYEVAALLSSVGPIVGGIRADYLQEKNVLANCHVNVIQLDDSHRTFPDYHKEYNFLVSDEERISWIADYCEKLANDGNTLILIDRIETGEMFERLIPGSVFINGKVKSKKRREEYKSIQSSTNKTIIATYGVAAVGINIPRIFNLVLLEPGKSFVRVVQSIGRGLRRAEDKDFVDIYDLTTTAKFSSKHLTERKKFYKEQGYKFTINKVVYRTLFGD